MDKQTTLLLGLVGVLGTVLLGLFAWDAWVPRATDYKVVATMSSQAQGYRPKITPILVQISGAVRSPGVYYVTPNQRVGEVLSVAGGVLNTADLDRLNLVTRIKDGKRINVPFEKSSSPKGGVKTPGASITFPISVNQSTAASLQAVPGIGPVMAGRIVADRQANGAYRSLEELVRVKGIGVKTVARLRPYLAVGR